MPNKIKVTFPVYRYHPKVPMGPNCYSTLKMYETPEPISDNWEAKKLAWSGKRLEYLQSVHMGTEGSGLVKSNEWLCRDHVAPGGILDASGQDIPIIGYNGALVPRSGLIDFLSGFAEIAGLRYRHCFAFGEPVQHSLDDFKSKLILLMSRQKGFPRPFKQIRQAETYLEVMAVQFGRKRAKHFNDQVIILNHTEL